jgi:tRNA pseudouridine55 synthase
VSPADAARRALPVVGLSAEQAVDLGHGKRIDTAAVAVDVDAGVGTGADAAIAAIDPDDRLIAIVERRGGTLKVVTGFPPEEASA